MLIRNSDLFFLPSLGSKRWLWKDRLEISILDHRTPVLTLQRKVSRKRIYTSSLQLHLYSGFSLAEVLCFIVNLIFGCIKLISSKNLYKFMEDPYQFEKNNWNSSIFWVFFCNLEYFGIYFLANKNICIWGHWSGSHWCSNFLFVVLWIKLHNIVWSINGKSLTIISVFTSLFLVSSRAFLTAKIPSFSGMFVNKPTTSIQN